MSSWPSTIAMTHCAVDRSQSLCSNVVLRMPRLGMRLKLHYINTRTDKKQQIYVVFFYVH